MKKKKKKKKQKTFRSLRKSGQKRREPHFLYGMEAGRTNERGIIAERGAGG